MRLIPAIDLRGGRCVRLLKGEFDAETAYAVEPFDLLQRYRELGADWVHVVDLDGARTGSFVKTAAPADRDNPADQGDEAGQVTQDNGALIAVLAAQRALKLQVGGGLRDEAAIERMLGLGVQRVVVGSAAVVRAREVAAWLSRFGTERVTLAFDVRLDESGVPRVATHGWRDTSTLSLWEAVAGFESAGLRHVLCTDVNRDGALSGPNVELYREATRRFAHIAWQASGGIRDAHDLHALRDAGAAAAISGKALLEHLIPAEDLQPFLQNA